MSVPCEASCWLVRAIVFMCAHVTFFFRTIRSRYLFFRPQFSYLQVFPSNVIDGTSTRNCELRINVLYNIGLVGRQEK